MRITLITQVCGNMILYRNLGLTSLCLFLFFSITLGCEKLLIAVAPILGSDLFNYCKSPPWPLLNNRILVLKNFLINKKIKNVQRSESNRRNVSNQLERAALIQVNNFSFANSLHLEMINMGTKGIVNKSCKEASAAFIALQEWGTLSLSLYENKVNLKSLNYLNA